MKLPIILYEHGDISIFTSIEEAEGWLEAIDVENNEYVAYDSEGQLLNLRVEGLRVTIREDEQALRHPSQLREILARYLVHPKIGVSESWVETASLSELISKGIEFKAR